MRILLLFLVLSAIGCKTNRILNTGPVPPRSKETLFDAIKDHNKDIDWFSAKTSIDYKSREESGKGSAYVRIKKDSIVWLNIRKFGIEFSRMLFTPDSIFVIYRRDQTFQKASSADYQDFYLLDVEFDLMQELMFGNIVIPDSNMMKIDLRENVFEIEANQDGRQLHYSIDGHTLLLTEFEIKDDKDHILRIKYSDYKTMEGHGEFAYLREFITQIHPQDISTMVMKISDVEINVPKTIKFEIPDHYIEIQ